MEDAPEKNIKSVSKTFLKIMFFPPAAVAFLGEIQDEINISEILSNIILKFEYFTKYIWELLAGLVNFKIEFDTNVLTFFSIIIFPILYSYITEHLKPIRKNEINSNIKSKHLIYTNMSIAQKYEKFVYITSFFITLLIFFFMYGSALIIPLSSLIIPLISASMIYLILRLIYYRVRYGSREFRKRLFQIRTLWLLTSISFIPDLSLMRSYIGFKVRVSWVKPAKIITAKKRIYGGVGEARWIERENEVTYLLFRKVIKESFYRNFIPFFMLFLLATILFDIIDSIIYDETPIIFNLFDVLFLSTKSFLTEYNPQEIIVYGFLGPLSLISIVFLLNYSAVKNIASIGLLATGTILLDKFIRIWGPSFESFVKSL